MHLGIRLTVEEYGSLELVTCVEEKGGVGFCRSSELVDLGLDTSITTETCRVGSSAVGAARAEL